VNPLPREIAPGVFWLGKCLVGQYEGKTIHTYNSAYVVVGERHTALVETAIPGQLDDLVGQLDGLLGGGIPTPRYQFVTHAEMAHSSVVGRMLERYPDLTVHGDLSDLHLVFPESVDRQHMVEPGERFDLGGREIVAVEGAFRDLPYTRWYFDTGSRTLFPGDGFAFAHWHTDDGCGKLAEEVPSLEITRQMVRYGFLAFHWTQFVELEPYVDRLEQLIFEELDAAMLAPSHGLPVGDTRATMPVLRAGFMKMEEPREAFPFNGN
jgi:flavorubredoxin